MSRNRSSRPWGAAAEEEIEIRQVIWDRRFEIWGAGVGIGIGIWGLEERVELVGLMGKGLRIEVKEVASATKCRTREPNVSGEGGGGGGGE